MASLFSEDNEVVSCLELAAATALDDSGEVRECWQPVALKLISGKRSISLGDSPDGGDKEVCLLCRRPDDEIKRLFNLLADLAEDRRQKIIFEPAEPSFEFILEKTSDKGIAVEVWVDSGNATTGFYRWDAMGARFFTNAQRLRDFMDGLQREFLS